MKKLIATLSTIAILTGSVAAPLPWTDLTGITIECQAATGTKTTVSVSGINYTVYYNSSTKQATIATIKKASGNLPASVTVPETIKIGSVSYSVTELGDGSSALFTASNAGSMTSLTLPVSLKKINKGAFTSASIPKLTTLYVNIDGLTDCDINAFFGSKVKYIYNKGSGYSYTVNMVPGFESCFGNLAKRKAFSGNPDNLYLKDYSLNGKLQFLSAVSMTPFSVQAGTAYANKVVGELFKAGASYTKLQKAEIIFNYLHTHASYKKLYDKTSTNLYYLSAQPMTNMALGSGVCGSYAHSFEFLCKAAGFSANEVFTCPMPGHAANAVKIDGQFYYVDATPTADVFMSTCGTLYGNCVVDKQKDVYHYTASPSEQYTRITFAGDPAHQTFIRNFSYIYIACDPNITVSMFDSNAPKKEYIRYTTRPTVSGGSTMKTIEECTNNLQSKLFIDTNTYYTMKLTVNGKTSQAILNPVLLEGSQTVTVDGKRYRVTCYRPLMKPGDPNCDGRRLSLSDDKYFNMKIEKLS